MLKRIEHRAVGLLDAFSEVLAQRFLLNHHFGGRDKAVDERGMVEPDLVLVDDEGLRVLNAEDLVEERSPENLALAFLIALALPMGGKLFGCLLLLDSIHSVLLCSARFRAKLQPYFEICKFLGKKYDGTGRFRLFQGNREIELSG